MDIVIKKAELSGSVKAIASKSQAHRLLICSALSEVPTELKCEESSEDIDATVRCLNALGAVITKTALGFHVIPISEVSKNPVLHCGESGSTLRFLLPIACALGADATLYSSGRLPERPLSPLYEQLIAHGCRISEQGKVPLKSSGRLASGRYSISGSISSQFISGLLFALPLVNGDSELELTGTIESRPYIDLTISALSKFGISLFNEGNLFHIKGGQRYVSPLSVNVEGDWSNAAFWLCAGAISQKPITCKDLDLNSRQGDRGIIDVLKAFGAEISISDSSVTVSGGNLKGIDIDAENIPDLIPVLAAVASVSQGKTTIRNAQRLRIKESDRLAAVTDTLGKLGADIVQTEDGLIITGNEMLEGGRVIAFGDHRIAMTAAVTACRCREPVTISGAEAVNKSYPSFFSDFSSLGGQIDTADRS